MITGLRRSRGDCLETEEVGGEKEFEETRSSERFLISTLSSAWTDLGLGIGITLAGEVRRMESWRGELLRLRGVVGGPESEGGGPGFVNVDRSENPDTLWPSLTRVVRL